MAEFSRLLGLTLLKADASDDSIRFLSCDGRAFLMHHQQDCCERVYIESIVGDLADLIGSPILLAEEAVGSEQAPAGWKESDHESCTWTFYKLATIKGYVDIRWCGSSNGYYSESVDFEETDATEELARHEREILSSSTRGTARARKSKRIV